MQFNWLDANPIRPATEGRIVVLDPGHGGHDHGASGPTGKKEKAICLALARELTIRLEEARYEVLLTRSDDYNVDLRHRTSIANHAKADLFISIHTGAGFLHGAEGMTVYYNQPTAQAMSLSEAENTDRLWRRQAPGQVARSRDLAHALAQTLSTVSGSPQVDITPAPLVVLAGAEVPAILVEVGYLTHAATEKKLNSQPYLETLASAMARGIVAYLTGSSPLAR